MFVFDKMEKNEILTLIVISLFADQRPVIDKITFRRKRRRIRN